MNFVPWLIDGQVAGHQHLDAKRVTRRVLESNVVADHHTPECLERQAVFREQLRTSCPSLAGHG